MRHQPAAQATALTPAEVIGILRRHLWLIISMTVLGVIAGGVAWYLLLAYMPKYTAQTYLKILPPIEKDPTIITTPLVNKDIHYGYRATIAALISQQSSLQTLIDRPAVQETKWFKRFARFDSQGEILNRGQCILKAFRDLEKRFRAYPERDREFVSLSMTCGDADEAAKIVNEMATWFVASREEVAQGGISAKLTALEEERRRIKRDLDGAEASLQEVRERWGFQDLTDPKGRYFEHTVTLKHRTLELQLDDLKLREQQLRAVIAELDELAQGPISVQIENMVENDPVMVMLAQQLALQEASLSARRMKFGEDHRVVRQAREMINEIKQKRQYQQARIAQMTRQAQVLNAQDQLVVIGEQLKALHGLRAEAEAQKNDYDAARVQFEQRLTIRDERLEALKLTKEQIEKLKMMHSDPETPKVQLTGPAPPPLEVSSPKWQFYFPGGTVLGLLAGFGLAFLIELLNDLVRTPRDVARYLHIPLLGVIPDAAEDRQVQDIDLCHVVRQAPSCVISESYRRLRTNLILSESVQTMKVLLVSSGMAAEGRTSVAVNLAATLVAENKRVLLIDANFRRPSLQDVFPKPDAAISRFGLSTMLAGLCSFEDAKRPNVIEGLDVIESGPLPSNPTELLNSYQMKQLIRDRRKSHDYIIIDTPPVLLVSDAKVLAPIVDGTVIVLNAAITRRGAAQRTIREFRQVNAAVTGCVLFAIRAMKGGYFQEQFKSFRKYQELQLVQPS
jgi:capsular exopolysaccharide synthesis family protein